MFARWASAALVAICALQFAVRADVIVSTPLARQLPPIAHTSTSYNWTIATDTFTYSVGAGQDAPSSPPSIQYTASGMPSWLTFDGTTRTFSGSVPDGGSGSKTTITVKGTNVNDQSSSATDTFSLLILSAPAPTLAIPIAKQLLGAANSLGTANLLPNNVLHIPLGWSFSVGLQWDTFTLPSGNEVYWSANLNGDMDLPSWMTWNPDTYDVYGVAPVNVPSGGQEYDIVFTGSNREGYGGTSDTLHIQVSSNTITTNGSLDAVEAAVGVPLQTTIDKKTLFVDGQQLSNASNVEITADLSSPDLSWLSYTDSNDTLSGTPPYDLYGKSNQTTSVMVPLTFSDTSGSKLSANKTILVAPYAFTALQLPNVQVQPGKNFTVDFHKFLRSVGTTANGTTDTRIAAVIQLVMQTPNVTTAYIPASASSWLSYDESSLLLSGNVPSDYSDRVQVLLTANGTSSAKGEASFYLTKSGDNSVGNPTGSSGNGDGGSGSDSGNGDGNHGGLSKGAKAAIGVVVGLLGLLALIIFLCCCCRRRRRKRDEQVREKSATPATDTYNTSGTDGDDHTLLEEAGIAKIFKQLKKSRSRAPNTPSTLAVTPRPEEKTTPVMQSDSAGSRGLITVESPTGRRRDISNEADEPMQNSIFSNLFSGGRVKSQPPGHKRGSTGLGLTLAGAAAGGAAGAAAADMSNRNTGRIHHQRSHNSIISQRSSWENDLFYEDAQPESEAVEQLNDEHDVPRRRGHAETGLASDAAFRHRHKHESRSPAFVAQDPFEGSHDMAGTTSSEFLNQNMPNFESDGSLSHSAHDDAYGGLHASHSANEGDARIMEARIMSVQRHSPMLHQGPVSYFQRSSQQSHDAVVRDAPTVYSQDDADEHIFDDADDDGSASHWHGRSVDRHGDVRNSTLSATHNSEAYQHGPSRVLLAPAAHETFASPKPSFMDGASITGIDPSESVRRVNPRPSTPTRPGSATSSNASRHLICPLIPATVGHLVSFHMYPNVPPPMAGAPGSPGKRSGRNVRYELIVEDPRPHLARYRGHWPAMLSDWLSFDEGTFEVVGVVPRGAGLELLGDCEIALLSINNSPRTSGTHLQRPEMDRKRSSYDSAHSHLDDEGEIVARARLVFHGGQGHAF